MELSSAETRKCESRIKQFKKEFKWIWSGCFLNLLLIIVTANGGHNIAKLHCYRQKVMLHKLTVTLCSVNSSRIQTLENHEICIGLRMLESFALAQKQSREMWWRWLVMSALLIIECLLCQKAAKLWPNTKSRTYRSLRDFRKLWFIILCHQSCV